MPIYLMRFQKGGTGLSAYQMLWIEDHTLYEVTGPHVAKLRGSVTECGTDVRRKTDIPKSPTLSVSHSGGVTLMKTFLAEGEPLEWSHWLHSCDLSVETI